MSVIVSMTTTSYRIDKIEPVLTQILNGNRPPERLVLNIGMGPSHLSCKGVTAVPENLQALAAKHTQLEFRFTKNLGPATKLLPTLREQWAHKQQIIVTADDDVYYPAYWLERLLHFAGKYPDTLLCYTARNILPAKKYAQWGLLRRKGDRVPSLERWALLPRGHDGVLYRPAFFTKAVFDLQQMVKTCPSNDDIWFTVKRVPETKVRVLHCHEQFQQVLRPERPLYATNADANDEMLTAVRESLQHLRQTEQRLAPTRRGE